MMLFAYDSDQRDAILASLPGTVHFGTREVFEDEIIAALTACACRYIERTRMTTAGALRRKLDALDLVNSLLDDPSDNLHRARIAREVDRWNSELSLVEGPKRERRARLRFMVDAFEVFAEAEGSYSPLVECLALSDSDSPARQFFEAAIAPVCHAAGEAIGIRAAISAFNVFKRELLSAEIELIHGELACEANTVKR